MWSRVVVALGVLGLVACGEAGNAPEVSGVTVSHSQIRRGAEFFVSAHVVDIDGDLIRGHATVAMDSVEGDTSVQETVLITGLKSLQTDADVTVGLTLFGAADLGPYDLSLTVEDGEGVASRPVTIRVTVTQ